MAVGFKRKKTTSPMEAIRRMLSKEGLSAKDKKDRAALQKRIDDATEKAKAKSKAAAKKRMMDDAPKGRGGKAANIMSKVKDTAPATTGKRKISDKNKTKVVGGFKKVGTKDPDAGRKQQGQITSKKSTKTSVTDKQKKTQTKMPTSVGAAQKAGKLYFTGKDGKKKLAITAAQLKKSGMTLRQFANKYKNKGMKAFLADLKKMAMGGAMMKKKGMAMGGSMKKKGMAMGGMKKKGMARGGMKKKGYAMGGLKATNPSQVGLRKLPQNVRNKMGYMKKGGMTKKGYARGGSMKKKGYAMGGVAKKYGIVDNRKTRR
jgi:hypothetical protein